MRCGFKKSERKYMKFLHVCLVLLLSCTAIVHTQEPNWTLLIYMEAPDLHAAAIKNITGLLQARASDDDANIFVQLHLPGSTAFRYRVRTGELVFEDAVTLSLNYQQDIIDAAAWAYARPAKHHALILWGHGSGILLPTWNAEQNDWQFEHDASLELASKRSVLLHKIEHHRAVLLNHTTHDYLTNDGMVNVVKTLSENILRKKLDILGFDCCLGAMIEHAYQISNYVHYLIGCQNCELPDGFDYEALGKSISENVSTPRKLVKAIVEDYGVYYAQHAPQGLYTLSGFDCSRTAQIKDLLDRLAATLAYSLNNERIIAFKQLIREHSIRFCWVPMYTDLYNFLTVTEQALQGDSWADLTPDTYTTLRTFISSLKTEIQRAVVANTKGRRMADAHGISIYLPYSHIDSSYYQTQFAQQSRWVELLNVITQG